jgi:hypothetical protein
MLCFKYLTSVKSHGIPWDKKVLGLVLSHPILREALIRTTQ